MRGWLSFSPITEKGSFWKIINEYKGNIYKVKLEMKSPNIFGASHVATKILEEIKNDVNSDVTTVQVENTTGALNISEEGFGDYEAYIEDGGGKYEITTQKDGQVKTHSSETHAAVVTIDGSTPEEILKSAYGQLIKYSVRH